MREKEIAQRAVQNLPESKEGRSREKEEKSRTEEFWACAERSA
ncbi:MAG: hypothetical protein WBK18_01945 [Thermacetogeniaceae bacterium]